MINFLRSSIFICIFAFLFAEANAQEGYDSLGMPISNVNKISFFPKLKGGCLIANFNQTLNAEDVQESEARHHTRSLSIDLSYAFGKSRTLGVFVHGGYVKGGTQGIWLASAGPQITFDLKEGLVGEEVGSIEASIRIYCGVGIRSGSTGAKRLIGYAKVLGYSTSFDVLAEFWGGEGIFGFYGRTGGKIFKFLRLGISVEKYPETTASAGLLLEGVVNFDRYTSFRIGGTFGAQVQKQMRFHWLCGLHANMSVSF